MISAVRLNSDETRVSIQWDRRGAPTTEANVLGCERDANGKLQVIWLRGKVEAPTKFDASEINHGAWTLTGAFTSRLERNKEAAA